MAQIVDNKWGRTDVFEIVDKFPEGYIIWNIGRENFPHECFIPLAQRKTENPKEHEYHHIKLDSLKTLKVESEELALYLMKYAIKREEVTSKNIDKITKKFKEAKQ